MEKSRIRRIQHLVKKAAEPCVDLLFPRICPLCGQIVTKEEGLICPKCRPKAERLLLRDPLCKKCGKQLEDEIQEYCRDCWARPKSFEWGVSVFAYRDEMKASMMGFKYQNKREFGDYYSQQVMEHYGGRLRRAGAQAVVPVPLHKKKLRARGYNQAEILARRLGEALELPVYPRGLIRLKNTSPQKNLGRGQRGQNLHHVFQRGTLPEHIKRIILTDDIYTTGATMDACARTLLQTGAEQVVCVSICSGRN